MATWRPEDLLLKVAATGYFDDPQAARDLLATYLEGPALISVSRALDVLLDAGLVTVRYEDTGAVHPKDQPGLWQLELTDAGRAALRK
jgi:hypothetical protein